MTLREFMSICDSKEKTAYIFGVALAVEWVGPQRSPRSIAL